ncbi:hypothetical protein LSTR_LSTR000020 [Laodelphax striatellus]|uniref:Uncharacterized protein n=1 Tax=Laodelphax striatellus TaxID=195883 RepID=A0A482X6P3_LAOST|nr:hypothetical protein LSTR_LSTR000020 [Laodelphax striatellus]
MENRRKRDGRRKETEERWIRSEVEITVDIFGSEIRRMDKNQIEWSEIQFSDNQLYSVFQTMDAPIGTRSHFMRPSSHAHFALVSQEDTDITCHQHTLHTQICSPQISRSPRDEDCNIQTVDKYGPYTKQSSSCLALQKQLCRSCGTDGECNAGVDAITIVKLRQMKNRRPSPRKERGTKQPTKQSGGKEREKERRQLYPTDGDPTASDSDDEGGFNKWLRTGDGFQYLRFFVVLNSLAVFLTMGWPQISVIFQALHEFFTEE